MDASAPRHPFAAEAAGKLTGMLLDLDNADLLVLLESPEDLQTKVADALAVLQEAATPRPAPAPAREEPPAADADAAARSPRASSNSPPPPPNPRSGRSTTDAADRALPRGGRPPRSPARIPQQAADDDETTPRPSRGRRRGRRKPRADGSRRRRRRLPGRRLRLPIRRARRRRLPGRRAIIGGGADGRGPQTLI